MPVLSVIIPCRNESSRIVRLLRDLSEQDFFGEYEVLVADGDSTDDTLPQLTHFQERERTPYQLRIIRNPCRQIPSALNLLVGNATGNLIIRIDAHARISSSYLSTIVAALTQPGIDVVGPSVRWIPRGESLVASTIADVLNSRLGNGGTPGRVELSGPRRTEHAVMSCYRREVWERIGGYDEGFLSNEDFEFDYRAHCAGFGVYSLPAPRYEAIARPTIRELAAQRWRYGYWKSQTLRKHPRSLKLRQLLPAMTIPITIGFAVASPLLLVATVIVYIAAAMTILFGTRRGFVPKGRRWAAIPVTCLALGVTHFVWAAGLWYGLGFGRHPSLASHPQHDNAAANSPRAC